MLQLDVNINFNILNIVKITGTGQIRLNTTPDSHTANGVTMGAHSFELYINGTVSLLDVIKVQTTVLVVVGGDVHVQGGSGDTAYNETVGEGDWFFLFSGDADFFGLATLHASGWVDSSGHFGVDLNGGITIGSSSFGLSGNFDVHAWLNELQLQHRDGRPAGRLLRRASTSGQYYSFGVAFSASVAVNAFGFSLASIGIGARLTAAGHRHGRPRRRGALLDLVPLLQRQLHRALRHRHGAAAASDLPRRRRVRPGQPGLQPAGSPPTATGRRPRRTPEPLYVNVGGRARTAAEPRRRPAERVGHDRPHLRRSHRRRRREDPDHDVRPLADVRPRHGDLRLRPAPATTRSSSTRASSRPSTSPAATGTTRSSTTAAAAPTIDGGAGNDVIQIGPDAGGTIIVTGGSGQDYILD